MRRFYIEEGENRYLDILGKSIVIFNDIRALMRIL